MGTLEILKTFTEPQRLRILNLLKIAALNVNEIVEIISASQSNISHHLKILKNLGLVEFQKEGNQNYYILKKNPDLPEAIKNLWDEIEDLIKELPEAVADKRNLLSIISKRDLRQGVEQFRSWRKDQPDLPFTEELAILGVPRKGIALDVGCGNGDFLDILKNTFSTIIGLDNASDELAVTHRKFHKSKKINEKDRKIELICADTHFLPFPESYLDAIYFRMTLGFLKEPEFALTECIRTLKPNGRISIIDRIPELKADKVAFNRKFFENIIQRNSRVSILEFKNLHEVFICTLEKNDS